MRWRSRSWTINIVDRHMRSSCVDVQPHGGRTGSRHGSSRSASAVRRRPRVRRAIVSVVLHPGRAGFEEPEAVRVESGMGAARWIADVGAARQWGRRSTATWQICGRSRRRSTAREEHWTCGRRSAHVVPCRWREGAAAGGSAARQYRCAAAWDARAGRWWCCGSSR